MPNRLLCRCQCSFDSFPIKANQLGTLEAIDGVGWYWGVGGSVLD